MGSEHPSPTQRSARVAQAAPGSSVHPSTIVRCSKWVREEATAYSSDVPRGPKCEGSALPTTESRPSCTRRGLDLAPLMPLLACTREPHAHMHVRGKLATCSVVLAAHMAHLAHLADRKLPAQRVEPFQHHFLQRARIEGPHPPSTKRVHMTAGLLLASRVWPLAHASSSVAGNGEALVAVAAPLVAIAAPPFLVDEELAPLHPMAAGLAPLPLPLLPLHVASVVVAPTALLLPSSEAGGPLRSTMADCPLRRSISAERRRMQGGRSRSSGMVGVAPLVDVVGRGSEAGSREGCG